MAAAKDKFLQIRLTSEQKESIRIAAKRANTDMSSWILSKVANSQSVEFLSLVKNLSTARQPSYVYAELHDFLMKCHSANFTLAVNSFALQNEGLTLDCFQINYVTAMVEHRAKQLEQPVPAWCSEIPKLEIPYFGSSLKSLNLYLLLSSPVAFRRRNIFIDSSIGKRV